MDITNTMEELNTATEPLRREILIFSEANLDHKRTARAFAEELEALAVNTIESIEKSEDMGHEVRRFIFAPYRDALLRGDIYEISVRLAPPQLENLRRAWTFAYNSYRHGRNKAVKLRQGLRTEAYLSALSASAEAILALEKFIRVFEEKVKSESSRLDTVDRALRGEDEIALTTTSVQEKEEYSHGFQHW